jgi:hypothetical protein
MELTEKELQEKIDNAVSGLKSKNDELLDKLSKFKDIDPELFTKLKDENEKLKDANMTETEKLKKTLSKQQKLIDDLNDANKKKETKLAQLKQDNVISNVITSAGVKIKKGMSEPLKLYLKEQMISNDDGYTIGGDKPEKYIEKFVKSDTGKNFFDLENAGGGAQGGDNSTSKVKAAEYFDPKSDNYNVTEQIKIKKSDPDLYNQLSKK